jgi:transposase
MECPPYSPDLNPIEHMWFPLKGAYNMKTDTENCQGSDEKEEGILWLLLITMRMQ